MPIPVTCPGCSARMNAPDAAAGKKVKCPKCQKVLTVPAPDADVPDFEVVEDKPVQPVKRPAPRPAAKPQVAADVVVDDDDEEDVRPRKKRAKAVAEDDEDDSRPRKKRRVADEDDEDERPRKKKKKQAAGGSSLARNIVGGVVLVILLGVVAFVFWDKFGKKEEVASNTPPAGDSPAGPQRPGPQGPGPVIPNGPGPKLPANGGIPTPDGSAGGASNLPKYRAIQALVVSADGKKLATLGVVNQQGKVSLQVWDLARGNPNTPREYPSSDLSFASPVALSPDGNTLAALGNLSDKCNITFWNVAAGTVIRQVTGPFTGTFPTNISFTADGAAVVAVSGGSFITAVAATGQVTVKKPQDSLTGREVFVPGLNRVAIVRPNDDYSAAELALWDPTSDGPAMVTRLGGTKAEPDAFAISPNGKMVVVCSKLRDTSGTDQAPLTIHELASGKLVGQLPGDEDPKCRRYTALSFSSDGKFLTGTGAGYGAQFNSLVLFRVAEAKRIYRKAVPPVPDTHDFAQFPRFSADGKALFYVQAATKIVSVDTETGKENDS